MQTDEQLNDNILNITMIINEKFPELAKYIGEMPVTIPYISNPEINSNNLLDYKQSLESLVKKYAKHHIDKKKII